MDKASGKEVITNMTSVTPRMKDYIGVIYDLGKTGKFVRVRDIAEKLDVTMPSVISMLKKLDKLGLLKYRKHRHVALEDKGIFYAQEIQRRKMVLLNFLTDVLIVEKSTAVEDASQIEYLLSPETLERLTMFMNFVKPCPQSPDNCPKRFSPDRSVNIYRDP